MEINCFADLRPRTVWDVLDDAFDLYRARFALLAGVSAVAYVPALLASVALAAGPFARTVRASARSGSGAAGALLAALFQFLGAGLIAWLLLYVAQSMQTGATCLIVEGRLCGRDHTVFTAWRRMLQRLPALLSVSVCCGFLSGLAALPSSGLGEILLAPFLAYQTQIVLLERQGVSGAFRRAGALGAYGYGKTLGLVLLSRLLAFFLGTGLFVIAIVVFSLLPGGDSGPDRLADTGRAFALFVLGAGISVLLVAPLLGIASTLLYYDLRVRREGMDIDAAAVEMGYPLAPDYFGGIAANPTGRRGA